jgi:hypothetical protein
MNAVTRYLHIPNEYCEDWARGLHWSEEGDAVELQNGVTFALTHEISLFLEGFIAGRRLIHFGHILHLLRLLGRGCRCVLPIPDRGATLHDKYLETGAPLRNAGAFCAVLCRNVTPVADPVEVDALSCHWVTNSALMSLLCAAFESDSYTVPEEPAMNWADFEDEVLASLSAYTSDEIEHWLRHGRGPIVEAADPLAQQILAVRPRPLAGVLAKLVQRDRLSGAVPLVDQLVGVLALPPRRLKPNELPVDGYTDVTTRGQPEQILPSQFALDDLEFVRRFAAHELLYFRREEPHAPLRDELVLLLDQGVRTWGDVRLVLSAAVFALGKRAARRDTPIHLATTSNGGALVDFRTEDTDAVGAVLEASDLTFNPALALETVLEQVPEGARDVVLLTHPRNLAEPDLAAAGRRASGPTRLFALAVDEHGDACFSEMRHGEPVTLCQFRVQWPPATPAGELSAVSTAGWTGDVEPVGFPFRFGLVGKVKHFAFNASGEWLLVVGQDGMLYLNQISGTASEVLPRGWFHNEVLTVVEAVLGVAGGFVVCGQLGMELVALHYDLAARRCTAHILGVPESSQRQWYYLEKFHAVTVQSSHMVHDLDHLVYGVDLGTGQRGSCMVNGRRTGKDRVLLACEETLLHRVPPPAVEVIVDRQLAVDLQARTFVYLDPSSGTVTLQESPTACCRFTPVADGGRSLHGGVIRSAQRCGGVLALSVTQPSTGAGSIPTLRLFSVSDGTPCGELRLPVSERFALTRDGRRVARLSSLSQVVVQDIPLAAGCWRSLKGRCHPDVQVRFVDAGFVASVGSYHHLIRWEGSVLRWRLIQGKDSSHLDKELTKAGVRKSSNLTLSHRPGAWSHLRYDARRFRRVLEGSIVVLIDVFGQIMCYSHAKELICMFFVFRDQLAAWMPDGTRYGPAALTGCLPTRGALERIGRALRAAAVLGRAGS